MIICVKKQWNLPKAYAVGLQILLYTVNFQINCSVMNTKLAIIYASISLVNFNVIVVAKAIY